MNPLRSLLVAGRRPGTSAFGYHRPATPIWLTLAVSSAVEILGVHLVLPAGWLRLVVLILGGLGLILVLGLWAGLVTRPYLVADDGVRVRQGLRRDLRLPWSAMLGVRAQTTRRWARAGIGANVTEEDGRLGYVVGGETRVVIMLRAPLDGASEVHLGVDDPAGMLAALQRNLDRDGDHELQQRERHQPEPAQPLQLVLPQPGVRHPQPDDHE
jgi:hypothetical protein